MSDRDFINYDNEPEEEEVSSRSEDFVLSEFYNGRHRANNVNMIKTLLMPFVFFALFGFPVSGVVGTYVAALSNFAALAFFVFTGFFTLCPDPERRQRKLIRGVKRSFGLFLIMFISYLALNVAYLAVEGSLGYLASPEFLNKHTFFDFIVLNVWPLPVGSAIWFIHSLAYSYLVLFLIEKLRLTKIYLPLTIILFVVSLLGGELAKLIGFPYFGYNYIPGGTVTKALPFMLAGMYLRKNIDRIGRIPRFVYLITFVLGVLISIGERILLQNTGLLGYTGNAVGYAVMAFSVCLYALCDPDEEEGLLRHHGRSYTKRMYAFAQPVSFIICYIFQKFIPEIYSFIWDLRSVISFIICLALAFFIGFLRFQIASAKSEKAA